MSGRGRLIVPVRASRPASGASRECSGGSRCNLIVDCINPRSREAPPVCGVRPRAAYITPRPAT
ncbi:hypothetical protein E2C01_002629 [Portunus trituberculatus]|uniref:Uncharacterized protein n=1 Tax=Portunus trituberculatus TaxID=210409 RepID=A0A5B7CMN7_PORTR|nr:hypothetical protein [Portunus trituberculatus]